MKNLIPNLWFNDQAEQAADFYVSVFPNSKIGEKLYYDEISSQAAGRPVGSLLTVTFEINGLQIVALNGGPVFKLNEAFSLLIPCDTQEELDHYWSKLSEGGEIQACGWLKDKFGLSWQIAPAKLEEWIHDADSERRDRVMKVLLQSKKLDFEPLEAAYAGR